VDQLPHSDEQALARFKLAEAQFAQLDYTNALLNIRSVLNDFSDLPRVKDALLDLALYQTVRASLQIGDLASAEEALKKILQCYPKTLSSDRSMLLVGQHLTSKKKSSEARLLFQELLRRFPNSSLTPEIDLAVARTFVQEKDWPAAIGKYEEWLEKFPTNELLPQAEFNRAWASAQAGEVTNALSLFTNFVARFPAHELAPRAQYWIASYYFNPPQNDFVAAEENFQKTLLLQNTNYAYQALMMAARAAMGRRAYEEAKRDYLGSLIEDHTCPDEIKAEAYFAL